MEEVTLVDAWIGDVEAIPILDNASASLVRERLRAEGARLGMPDVPVASLVSAASELAHNQLAHAHGGMVAVREVSGPNGPGLEVIAADRGPGVVDVALALEGGRSHAGSLGAGLAAVLELADEVDIDVRIGEGFCVRARKYARASTRGRRVGVYGKPFPGERTSGDDAAFVRSGGALLVGLADGLGHGPAAREASNRAMGLLVARPDVSLEGLLSECDKALAGTRGAVMTAARLDDLGSMTLAAVGNVGAHVYGPAKEARFGGSSFVLGARSPVHRIASETHLLGARDVLVLFSDGIKSRMDLAGELDLLREHPVVVAQRVVERFARPDDDVLVLVVG